MGSINRLFRSSQFLHECRTACICNTCRLKIVRSDVVQGPFPPLFSLHYFTEAQCQTTLIIGQIMPDLPLESEAPAPCPNCGWPSLSESEAKTKWCPFARIAGFVSVNRDFRGNPISRSRCLGSTCMAWDVRGGCLMMNPSVSVMRNNSWRQI